MFWPRPHSPTFIDDLLALLKHHEHWSCGKSIVAHEGGLALEVKTCDVRIISPVEVLICNRSDAEKVREAVLRMIAAKARACVENRQDVDDAIARVNAEGAIITRDSDEG